MNPIFLDLGYFQIHWYSVIILAAFLIGGKLATVEAVKWKIPKEFMTNLFFYIIIFSLIGARLYYVAFNLDYYLSDPIKILKVWEGGLAIHGGIIVSLIVVIFYSKKYRVNTMRLLDILVVSLILGQAIGRWGNFFNMEAHGPVTTLEHLQSLHIPEFIINGMNIEGVYYEPTFLYESLACLLGFFILIIYRSMRYTKVGATTGLYFIWYGIIRFFIESLRTDSLMIGEFKIA